MRLYWGLAKQDKIINRDRSINRLFEQFFSSLSLLMDLWPVSLHHTNKCLHQHNEPPLWYYNTLIVNQRSDITICEEFQFYIESSIALEVDLSLTINRDLTLKSCRIIGKFDSMNQPAIIITNNLKCICKID